MTFFGLKGKLSLQEKCPNTESFWPVFSSIQMNTEIYSANFCFQSECGKVQTRKTLNSSTFHALFYFHIDECHKKKTKEIYALDSGRSFGEGLQPLCYIFYEVGPHELMNFFDLAIYSFRELLTFLFISYHSFSALLTFHSRHCVIMSPLRSFSAILQRSEIFFLQLQVMETCKCCKVPIHYIQDCLSIFSLHPAL